MERERWSFSGGSVSKDSAAMPETGVQSLGQEDPLEKEMAVHSSTLAWKIPWIEESGGLQSMGSQRVEHNLLTKPPKRVIQYVSFHIWLLFLDIMFVRFSHIAECNHNSFIFIFFKRSYL